jgi:hypothetical protein
LDEIRIDAQICARRGDQVQGIEYLSFNDLFYLTLYIFIMNLNALVTKSMNPTQLKQMMI